MRFVYTFIHGSRTVEFGPYETQAEAAEAFQWRYGYWPDPSNVTRREWKASK